MEAENQSQPEVKTTSVKSKIWIAVGGVLLATGIYSFFKPASKAENSEEGKTEALFHRDEPTKGQIYQDDYQEKIEEMIDSGKSVREISKETGIRLDEVRKIKKRAKAETKQPSIK